MTEHPGEQVPPAFDPDVEPGVGPEPGEHTPDYDTEPEPESTYDEPPADDFPGDSQADQASYGEPADEAAVEQPSYEEAVDEARYDDSAGDTSYGEASYGEAVDEPAGEGAHPLVEEAMTRLDRLRERPVGEHAEVYADLHERLQNALVEADAESGDRT